MGLTLLSKYFVVLSFCNIIIDAQMLITFSCPLITTLQLIFKHNIQLLDSIHLIAQNKITKFITVLEINI